MKGGCLLLAYFIGSHGHDLLSSFFLTGFFFNKFIIYLFLAALGLHCCARAFSSCGEQGLLLVAVPGLLIVMASLGVEHGL